MYTFMQLQYFAGFRLYFIWILQATKYEKMSLGVFLRESGESLQINLQHLKVNILASASNIVCYVNLLLLANHKLNMRRGKVVCAIICDLFKRVKYLY